jgi:hypothetical protein
MNQAALTLVEQALPNPPVRNAAVERCCAARDRSLQHSRAKKLDDFHTKERADEAYRDAMPDLSGYENIRDFIACISHGMLSGGIHPIEGPKFLYAAQIAVCALRLEPKEPKKAAAEPTPLYI